MGSVNTDMGPVSLIDKGAYSAATLYELYQAVSYNNGYYFVKTLPAGQTNLPAGTLPTNTTYWAVVCNPTAMNTATQNATTQGDYAKTQGDAAKAAVSDIANGALRVAASKWDCAADGSGPITIYPATSSPVQVVASATGAAVINGATVQLTANAPYEFPAVAGANTISATSGTLKVAYNRDSMSMLRALTDPVTATGPMAQIDGCINDVPLDVVVRTVVTQAGTGDSSPINIRPIPGIPAIKTARVAHNFSPRFAPSTQAGITLTALSDGGVSLSGTATGSGPTFTVSLPASIATGQYTLSANNSDAAPTGVVLSGSDATGIPLSGAAIDCATVGAKITITIASKPLSRIDIRISTGVTLAGFAIRPQLESGSVSTTYQPYIGNTYPITPLAPLYGLPEAPDEVDVRNGAVTRRTEIVSLTGTELWTQYGSYGSSNRFVLTRNNAKRIGGGQICSHVPPLTGAAANAVGVFGNATAGQINIMLPASVAIDVTAYKNWLVEQAAAGKPVQVLYMIETPTTVSITVPVIPSLSGINNVYSDGGGNTTATGRLSGAGMGARIAKLEQAVTAITGG